MNTLYININGDDIKGTENMTVVGKPEDAIINKFYSELVRRIVEGVTVPGIGEVKKKSLVTDFELINQEAFTIIKEQWEIVKQTLLGENPIGTQAIVLPNEYIEWLKYHSNPIYNEIAKSLARRGNAVEINIGNIYRNGILLLVNNIDTDKEYSCFVVNDEFVDEDSAIAVAIRKRIGEDVPFIVYDDFGKCPKCGKKPCVCQIDEEKSKDLVASNADQPKQDKSIAFLTFKNIDNSCETLEWESEECPACGWMGLQDLGNDNIVCEECGYKLDEDEIDAIQEEFYKSHEGDNGMSKMELFDSNGRPICDAIDVPNPDGNDRCLPNCSFIIKEDGHDLIEVDDSAFSISCKYYHITKEGISAGNDSLYRSNNNIESSPFQRSNKRKFDKYMDLFDIVDKHTGKTIIRDVCAGNSYYSGYDDCFFNLVGDGLWSVDHYNSYDQNQSSFVFSREFAYLLPYGEDIYQGGIATKDDSKLLNTEYIRLPYANKNRLITIDDDAIVRIRKTNGGEELYKGNSDEILFKHPFQFGKALAVKVDNDGNELVYFDLSGRCHSIHIESSMLCNDPYEIDCYMVSENCFVFRPMDDAFQYLYNIEGKRLFRCERFSLDWAWFIGEGLDKDEALFNKFENGGLFNGALVFQENYSEGVIDMDGKIILPAKFDEIHIVR